MNKRQLRRELVSRNVSIAEIVRQTNVSRMSLQKFRDTGQINPATLATVLLNFKPPKPKKGKGEDS